MSDPELINSLVNACESYLYWHEEGCKYCTQNDQGVPILLMRVVDGDDVPSLLGVVYNILDYFTLYP